MAIQQFFNVPSNCIYCGSNYVRMIRSKSNRYICRTCNKTFTNESNPNRGITINHNRYCKICNELKPLTEFYKSNTKSGRRATCKPCYLKKEFNGFYRGKNITRIEYENILIQQNNKCKICNDTLIDDRLSFIDHNHDTNEVRGILCPKCNTALGLIRENITILKNMIKYLK